MSHSQGSHDGDILDMLQKAAEEGSCATLLHGEDGQSATVDEIYALLVATSHAVETTVTKDSEGNVTGVDTRLLPPTIVSEVAANSSLMTPTPPMTPREKEPATPVVYVDFDSLTEEHFRTVARKVVNEIKSGDVIARGSGAIKSAVLGVAVVEWIVKYAASLLGMAGHSISNETAVLIANRLLDLHYAFPTDLQATQDFSDAKASFRWMGPAILSGDKNALGVMLSLMQETLETKAQKVMMRQIEGTFSEEVATTWIRENVGGLGTDTKAAKEIFKMLVKRGSVKKAGLLAGVYVWPANKADAPTSPSSDASSD
ncbi:hypothetical protein H696_00211 [Fonticula alba]|uniref:Uncharacterized protein n=1 Tax=Fonticula alba TaxID=691883 RepID=A0A058ZGK1_FONAL|nr:hypothetical protein H696_00211 [Fonticula alba]KCV72627.1 hypothetical protein H696_00211 [Fonticula alba]|eukprot:XP_009492328.1 hypothetical protein H696_00211 [Fonticula alba]